MNLSYQCQSPQMDKFQLEPSPFAPAAILQATELVLADSARGKGLALETSWRGANGSGYRADVQRVRQMLVNLANNAIKFTAHGTIRLEACEIARDNRAAMLEFAVFVFGILEDQYALELLFRPGGADLDLLIDLARALGGEAGVESRFGRGSRFWFRIRAELVSPDEEAVSHPTVCGVPVRVVPSEPGPFFSGRALVADDNPVARKLTRALLTKLGLDVTLAEDGQQGVNALLGGNRHDILFLDCDMPVLDGYGATERIRGWESATARPRLPIVAVTANASSENVQRCLDVGMDAFLAKPLMIADLKTQLRQWLPMSCVPVCENVD